MKELYITKNHTGKMEGMQSLSTSCKCNPICIARRNMKGSICEKCYSWRQLSYQPALQVKLAENYAMLTQKLNDSQIPIINALYFRFEAFGDLSCAEQAKNYIRIALKNKKTTFAIWTKNLEFLNQAIKELGKPKNLIVIYSTPVINNPLGYYRFTYPFVDKFFTVYDGDTIAKNNIKINCGSKKCLECLKCYKKTTTKIINERIK